jgi:hypothetical protein
MNSSPSRYVVGLDLGTTNSALAYVDTEVTPWRIETFSIPQLVAPGQVEARETLPSFLYQPASGEFPAGSLRLPWQKDDPGEIVGQFARDHGTLVPGRLVASAKSWLSHSGVDRTADVLPWHGAPDVRRLSPVAVSARYVQHVRAAWDARFPEHPLAGQEFVLTLPASFDEVARELTIRAARQAGLKRVVLIEEPQAAFYAWIAKHAADWDQRVAPGQTILICDVGGGTSDFTLIRVRRHADGTVQFHRAAVGEHLILGGDNMDLALAHHIERRLTKSRSSLREKQPFAERTETLDPRSWSRLLRSCRHVKELLMGDAPPEQHTLTIGGAGSRLIGGSIQMPVAKAEVDELIVDGFFPRVELVSKPQAAQSGFQEFGLPYAADAAITKHLAAFLTAHGEQEPSRITSDSGLSPPRVVGGRAGDESSDDSPGANTGAARPDVLLFNGGVFGSPQLRQRLVDVLESWFRGDDPEWKLTVLDHERLDLAVAKGAAYYGMVRRGEGVRIAAGLARTYYVGVAGDPPSAVCLAPAGIEPGEEIDLSQRQFAVLVAQPIEFPIYYSSVRLNDRPGEVVPVDREQFTALPPIRTVLKAGQAGDADRLLVDLHARLNEIGTLDLWCKEIGGKRSWKLMFDIRSATQTDIAGHESSAESLGIVTEDQRQAAETVIRQTFSPAGEENAAFRSAKGSPFAERKETLAPAQLMDRLTQVLDQDRAGWPPSLLRQLWEVLMDCESGRRLSPQHEARWLNLVGFCLRPGYGFALDDWRAGETWKLLQSKLVHNSPMCRPEWWILWRRVAGGLLAGQQQALIGPVIGQIRQLEKLTAKGGGWSQHEAAEVCRAAGAMELLPVTTKIELGSAALGLLSRGKIPGLRSALLWMLGRIGARRPQYGPLNLTVDLDHVKGWLDGIMHLAGEDAADSLAVMQLARKTGDRYRDLDDGARDQVLKWMDRVQSPKKLRRLVREVGTLDSEQQALIFGEALPVGLRLV